MQLSSRRDRQSSLTEAELKKGKKNWASRVSKKGMILISSKAIENTFVAFCNRAAQQAEPKWDYPCLQLDWCAPDGMQVPSYPRPIPVRNGSQLRKPQGLSCIVEENEPQPGPFRIRTHAVMFRHRRNAPDKLDN